MFPQKFHVNLGAALFQKVLLAEGFTNFNHDSFGFVPREVREAQQRYSLVVRRTPR
jgi:hypothetical protein